MSKHLTTVGRKNSLLTGRNLQQQLGVRGERQDKELLWEQENDDNNNNNNND